MAQNRHRNELKPDPRQSVEPLVFTMRAEPCAIWHSPLHLAANSKQVGLPARTVLPGNEPNRRCKIAIASILLFVAHFRS
jgi:hypothetical protein